MFTGQGVSSCPDLFDENRRRMCYDNADITEGKSAMYISERQWDQRLHIVTTGLSATHADLHHNAYEPTPYTVLGRLVERGHVPSDSKWIDYGCGKGRVSFFLHRHTGCRVTGVEFQEEIWQAAEENRRSYGQPQELSFVCSAAESFPVKEADHFYFFNPFSVPILQKVLNRIWESYYEKPRPMRLFFYYPTEEYVSELMNGPLTFLEKLDCMDLFAVTDKREHILIFGID